MATRKKAAVKKRAAKKKSGETAVASTAAPEGNEADLYSPVIVTVAAEGLLETVSYVHFDATAVVNNVPVVFTESSTASRGGSDGSDNDQLLQALRDAFIRTEPRGMPYLRVVGKVVEVLTVHRAQRRGKDHCSVGEVFLVFLDEIPQHSQYDPGDYRLLRPTRRGNRFDVTLDPGKTMFAGRLKKLKLRGYLTPANTTRSGGERGYRLSTTGRILFDGWPDVEGLQLDPPDEHE